MSRLGVYDPQQVTVIWGSIIVEGFADGTFISAERNSESFTQTIGSTGDATRARSQDKSGRVTITLLQSSPTNNLLSAAMLLDENTPNGGAIAPLLVTDLNGQTVIAAETAWLVQPATVEYARENSDREWVLETNNLAMNVGGNVVPGGAL